MRRAAAILMLMGAVVANPSPAGADGTAGVLGGVTRATVGADGVTLEPRYSGAATAFVDVSLAETVGVRVEAGWVTRGFDYWSRGGESHTAHYLEVPVLLSLGSREASHFASPYLLLGLAGGVRLHESSEAASCEGCSGITELPRLNVSVVGGAGVRIGHRAAFLLEARYAQGLKKSGWDDGRWDGGTNTTRDVQLLGGLSRRW